MVPDAPAVVVRAKHGQEDHLGSGFPRCHGLIGTFPAERLIQVSSQDCLADRRETSRSDGEIQVGRANDNHLRHNRS